MDIICSDIHAQPKYIDEIKRGFNAIVEYTESIKEKGTYGTISPQDFVKGTIMREVHNKKDRLFILGDLWDHKSYLKFGSEFYTYFMEQVAPHFDEIFIMEGTPSHDYDGFDMFKYIPKIRVITEATVVRTSDKGDIIIFLPQKSVVDNIIPKLYIVDAFTSDKMYKEPEILENVTWKDLAELKPKWKNMIEFKPKYLFGHFYIHGASYGGVDLPVEMVTERPIVYPEDILSVGAKFNIFGHIHTPQKKLEEMGIVYCGSMYAKSWGETDDKHFIAISDFLEMSMHSYGNPKKYLLDKEDKKVIDKIIKEGDIYAVRAKTKITNVKREEAESIYKARYIGKKIELYAKAKGIHYTESLKEKVNLITKE